MALIAKIIKIREELDKINAMVPAHTMQTEMNFEAEELIKKLSNEADLLLNKIAK